MDQIIKSYLYILAKDIIKFRQFICFNLWICSICITQRLFSEFFLKFALPRQNKTCFPKQYE